MLLYYTFFARVFAISSSLHDTNLKFFFAMIMSIEHRLRMTIFLFTLPLCDCSRYNVRNFLCNTQKGEQYISIFTLKFILHIFCIEFTLHYLNETRVFFSYSYYTASSFTVCFFSYFCECESILFLLEGHGVMKRNDVFKWKLFCVIVPGYNIQENGYELR